MEIVESEGWPQLAGAMYLISVGGFKQLREMQRVSFARARRAARTEGAAFWRREHPEWWPDLAKDELMQFDVETLGKLRGRRS